MTTRPIPTLTALLALALALAGPAVAQPVDEVSRFRLTVPNDPRLTSSAAISGNELVIVDAAGQRTLYERAANLDSPDGRLVGFHSRGANQSLRWPVTGRGAFLIGDARGNWRQSQMVIEPLAVPRTDPRVDPRTNPRTDPRTVTARRFPNLPETGQAFRGPIQPALLETGNESAWAGYVTSAGRLHLGHGWGREWQHDVHDVSLVPGAPLVLVPDADRSVPTVYSVDGRGSLVRIDGGAQLQPIRTDVPLAPGGYLADLGGTGFAPGTLAAVDSRGRLVQFDPARRSLAPILPDTDRFAPGIPLAVVPPGPAQPAHLFLVDRSGMLLQIEHTGGAWSRPLRIGNGFLPGGRLAVVREPRGNGLLVAGADRRGRVQVFRTTAGGWSPFTLPDATFDPGAALGFANGPRGLVLSGVGADGVWRSWSVADWSPHRIGAGFRSGSPVAFLPGNSGPWGFAVDPTGRLVGSHYHGDEWESHLLVPGYDLAPQLVRRRVVPHPANGPVRVLLQNSSPERLTVQIHDPSQPTGYVELQIPPGETVQQTIRRDAGGVLEETYLVPTLAGVVERVEQYPIPPQSLQSAVVYANRTTYSYIDRRKNKPAGALADFDIQTPVSLGVFDFPPGDLLRENEVIDVYRLATFSGNPGAAVHFPPPRP